MIDLEIFTDLLIFLDAQAIFICIPIHLAVGEEVICLVWCQRSDEVFTGGLERAAPAGPPSLHAFYSFSTG